LRQVVAPHNAGPMNSLADLAAQDPRWKRLLNDPDNLFNGEEAISEGYEKYLLGIVSIMEENGCTFKQAVMISPTGDPKSPSELGVVDFLRMRKAGYRLSDALVWNLKAYTVGPARASMCAWRRKEARKAIAKGVVTVELTKATLANGLDCTQRELMVVEQSLVDAQHLCWHLDRALEILEANSRACGEGESIMTEYAELSEEAVAVSASLEECANQLIDLRAGMWSFEYIRAMVRYVFSPPEIQRARCCTPFPAGSPKAQLLVSVRQAQEMRVEVLGATALERRGAAEKLEAEIGCSSEVDAACSTSAVMEDGLDERNREVYVEVDLGGCRQIAPMDQHSFFARRNMLFAYCGEPTVHVQVFETSKRRIQSLLSGDTLIGEAHLLLDAPSEDFSPRSVDLSISRQGKQTGIVLLRYQLIAI